MTIQVQVYLHFMRVDPGGLHEVFCKKCPASDGHEEIAVGMCYKADDGDEQAEYVVWDILPLRCMDAGVGVWEKHIELIPQPNCFH